MELRDALEQATLILDEEQRVPSLNYRYISDTWPHELRFDYSLKTQGYTPASAAAITRSRTRSKATREVDPNPHYWQFESVNYSLLMALFVQLSESHRGFFIGGLLNTRSRQYVEPARGSAFPSWDGQYSSLPLLAEFAIRNGYLKLLLDVLAKQELPNGNLITMMMELHDAICLNFDVFSDAELAAMPEAMKGFREVGERQTYTARTSRNGGPAVENKHYKQGFSTEGRELVRQVDSFLALCAQARYLYLKGALQQTRNLEIETDKRTVEGYLDRLGFSDLMVKSLNAAESLYKNTSTAFELKSSLGHLRSFLEHLHREAAQALSTAAGAPVADSWGKATRFLQDNRYLTKKEEEFITAIYTIMSDESVHPLIAEQEYARLFRNVVIEYGVLFLATLDKKGASLKPSSAQTTMGTLS